MKTKGERTMHCKECGYCQTCSSIWKETTEKEEMPPCYKVAEELREETQRQFAAEILKLSEEKAQSKEENIRIEGRMHIAFMLLMTIINIIALILRFTQ